MSSSSSESSESGTDVQMVFWKAWSYSDCGFFSRGSQRWTIRDMKKLLDVASRPDRIGMIKSDVFHVKVPNADGGVRDVGFFMELTLDYPDDSDDDSDRVSISTLSSGYESYSAGLFLHRHFEDKDDDESLTAQFNFLIGPRPGPPNATWVNNEFRSPSMTHRFSLRKRGTHKGNGNSSFISKKELLSKIEEDGSLRIDCKVEVYSDYPVQPPVSIKSKLASLSFGEQLMASEEGKDVKLFAANGEGKDGEPVRCHKIILTTRSSVFRAMFGHDTEESRSNTVRMQDVDRDTLKDFVRFLYTDKSALLDRKERFVVGKIRSAAKLVAMADKYDVEALKCRTENVLFGLLSMRTCSELAGIGDMYNCKALQESVMDFVFRNFTAASKRPWFEELPAWMLVKIKNRVAYTKRQEKKGKVKRREFNAHHYD